ncbi:hypothetical protein WSK_0047 [Novosphingobium sp. Rr 2-17]|uniref:PilZ domain-containing protein n=1 Tax=Novosphingobium sp. Rr 2-17 TaxID=555793 RepID=UPI000269A787|nr:PilZ domain-containing protein [Novosphingobium sp. Rr 2-17]EIZ81340.1 hypothetical protein WSK_0047 [Novosphingobium sp. Rr 2-17]
MVSTGKERYATAAQEDRSALRRRISIPANLRPAGAESYQTALCDLSIAGFCATAINPVHPGTICWLTLPGLESLRAKAVWWDNSLIGCAFEQLLTSAELANVLAKWDARSGEA